jgi:transmembrane sensor
MDKHLIPGQEDKDLPFYFKPKQVNEVKRINNWHAISNGINENMLQGKNKRLTYVSFATAFFVGVIGAIWFFTIREIPTELTTYATGFGKVKIMLLPDSSKLILNANSTVKIPKDWKTSGNREVWLEGEAYFEVSKKIATGQKFIVHTNQVDVEVLGTRFNVNTRRSESIVALAEGKVQLAIKEKGVTVIKDLNMPSLVLKPGQVAKVDSTLHVSVAEETNIDRYASWVQHEYHFDNTSLGTVAGIIEDTYGYKMIVQDSTLLQRSISGDLRAENIDAFVNVLQATFSLKMTIDKKTIIISQP